MSQVELLTRAIERLETLRAESTPKPWHYAVDDLTNEVDVWHDQEHRSHIANFGVAGMPRVLSDADLIVTLHRTIDAQLAVLRNALGRATSKISMGGGAAAVWSNEHDAVALAHAILGDDV